MPHSVASDQGLHCLPVILLGVSRLQWIKPELELSGQIPYFLMHWQAIINWRSGLKTLK